MGNRDQEAIVTPCPDGRSYFDTDPHVHPTGFGVEEGMNGIACMYFWEFCQMKKITT
jgi:hypothetical protein